MVGWGVWALQILWEELPNRVSRRLGGEVGRTEGKGQVQVSLENTLFSIFQGAFPANI